MWQLVGLPRARSAHISHNDTNLDIQFYVSEAIWRNNVYVQMRIDI